MCETPSAKFHYTDTDPTRPDQTKSAELSETRADSIDFVGSAQWNLAITFHGDITNILHYASCRCIRTVIHR